MGDVYAIANQKGGVGKTTTAVNVAACVARAGAQTLLVDLDPQCNATVALGGDRDMHPSAYDCLVGEVSLAEALQPREIAVYGKQSTGEKYLINPNKGIR